MMSVEQPIMITDTNSDDGVKDDFNSDDLKTLDNNQWLNDKVSKFLHQRSMIVYTSCAMQRASSCLSFVIVSFYVEVS